MKKRKLGSTLLEISEIGLGCMSLGTEEKEATSTIHAAIDAGINYFDTADLYDFGKNEEILGKALIGRRDKVILATKVGNRWNDSNDSWHWDPSGEYIKNAVKDSLHRLKTDYIDYYQLHGGTIEDQYEETVYAFDELVKEGLIRYYGISSIRPNVIKRFVDHSSIQGVMMQYNLLERRPEEFFPFFEENNISVIARGSVAKGLLTSNWEKKLSYKGYLSYSELECKETILKLNLLLNEKQSLHSLALHYLLNNRAVASLAVGARNKEQLLDNIDAYNAKPLNSHQIAQIKEITQLTNYVDHR